MVLTMHCRCRRRFLMQVFVGLNAEAEGQAQGSAPTVCLFGLNFFKDVQHLLRINKPRDALENVALGIHENDDR